MSGKYGKYWPMRKGGPKTPQREIFKCTGCGAETHHDKGYNGEPDTGNCHHGCEVNNSDWKPGSVTNDYKNNFERTFPNSPGAGI